MISHFVKRDKGDTLLIHRVRGTESAEFDFVRLFSIYGSLSQYPNSLSRGTVAQSVERPLKVPVRCNFIDVGLNHAAV